MHKIVHPRIEMSLLFNRIKHLKVGMLSQGYSFNYTHDVCYFDLSVLYHSFFCMNLDP